MKGKDELLHFVYKFHFAIIGKHKFVPEFVSVTVMVKLWFNDGQTSLSPVLIQESFLKRIKYKLIFLNILKCHEEKLGASFLAREMVNKGLEMNRLRDK